MENREHGLNAARGIRNALAIAFPFWLLVCGLAYLIGVL